MLLKDLVDVYNQVSSFSEKLKKIDIVARFLRNTSEKLLPIVYYMLKGKIFPDYSSEELEVGWTTL